MSRRHGIALPALLLAVALIVALAGCASLPAPAPATARPAATTGDYEFTGRISVRHGDARYIANLSWQHDASHDAILLATPMGQGLAELSRDASGAQLIAADGRRLAAADWDGLAAQAFGVELPLASIGRWLVADAPAGAQRDAAGRPLAFRQDGWSVAYEGYASEDPGARPRLIEIRREDIELRLKIDAWQEAR